MIGKNWKDSDDVADCPLVDEQDAWLLGCGFVVGAAIGLLVGALLGWVLS